jgi:hypothetical protein
MKNPLSYQSTEYDCGPTSMLNAVNFLFHRKDISPEVIRNISLYCLDSYNKKGEAHKSGTTGIAMLFLSNWLNQFGKVKKWPIYTEMLNGEGVVITPNSKVTECLRQGGAVVARLMLGCWHYVLLTGIDDEYVYLFDPYYRVNSFSTKGIEMIKDQPTKFNRKIKHEILNSQGKGYYALGPLETRECMLLFNEQTRMGMESIEYFI